MTAADGTPGPDPSGGTDLFPDERTVARAVRRGRRQVAWTVIVWLLTVFVVVRVALLAAGAASPSGDPARLLRLGYHAVQVAHPEYETGSQGSSSPDPWTWSTTHVLQYQVRARAASSQPYVDVTVRQPLWREADYPRLDPEADTPIRRLFSTDPDSSAYTASLLAALPSPSVLTALVVLRTPADEEALEALMRANDIWSPLGHGAVYVEDPWGRGAGPRALSWPNPDLGTFRAWAGELRPGDDAELERIGLRSSAEIEKVAADARIHAVILDRATRAQLSALLADPGIRSVTVADIALDSGPYRTSETLPR